MTTEHSTYTYKSGAQETVTLSCGPMTPHGHALLKINYSDGEVSDCYVNTGWLRDRLDDLGEPRRTGSGLLSPDAITDEARDRAYRAVAALSVCDWDDMSSVAKGRAMAVVEAVIAEITRPEPPARPEGAEDIEVLLFDAGVDENRAEVANYLAARLTDPTRKEA